VAAIPEIIWDGETGFLIPAGDEQALVIALRRLIDDSALRYRQGRQAAELVRKNFDAARNAARLLDLLKQTIHEAAAKTGERDSPKRTAEQTL
jgi:glycosyltransferase involved in cell wall biosynthesis